MPDLIACFTNSYGRFGPEAALRLLPEAGITRVELPIKTEGVPSFFRETPLLTDASTPADVARVRRLADAAGVTIGSVNLSSGNVLDAAVVARTIAKLDRAAWLGVELVVGGGGDAGGVEGHHAATAAPAGAALPIASEATASGSEFEARRRTLIAHLCQIGDAAAERGIVYCCETHPGAFQNADQMLATLQAVDHPHVRINFDSGNLLYYNRPPTPGAAGANAYVIGSLRQVAPFVRHVHLKDTPGGFQEWVFRELGSGVIDFRALRETLRAVGFEGPYSLEIEGVAGEPELTLEEHQARVRASVRHLRQCGFQWPETAGGPLSL